MDKALKQRLVGATVLVLLAVIVLPMLLSGPGDPGEGGNQPIELPPRPDDLAFETRRFPVGEGGQSTGPVPSVGATTGDDDSGASLSAAGEPVAPAEAGDEAAITEEPPATMAETETEVDPVVADADTEVDVPSPADAPASTEAPPAAEDEPPREGRYLVQVASFSSAGNADRLAARLRESGQAVVRDRVESGAGVLHRVRVGPFADRGDAEAARTAIVADMPDLAPRLVDLAPDDAESSPPEEEAALSRWVVQAGSFAEEANAARLVNDLRAGGFAATAVAIDGAAGRSWKVWVGPEIRRAEAERLARRLASEQGIDGLVMSAD